MRTERSEPESVDGGDVFPDEPEVEPVEEKAQKGAITEVMPRPRFPRICPLRISTEALEKLKECMKDLVDNRSESPWPQWPPHTYSNMSYSNRRTAIYATEEYKVRRTIHNICDNLLEQMKEAEAGSAAIAASATGYSAPPPTWGDAIPAAWALPELYRAHRDLQMEIWSVAFSADSNTTPTPATYFGENLEETETEEDVEEPLRKVRIDIDRAQSQASQPPRECIRIQDIDWGPLLASRGQAMGMEERQKREIRIDRYYG